MSSLVLLASLLPVAQGFLQPVQPHVHHHHVTLDVLKEETGSVKSEDEKRREKSDAAKERRATAQNEIVKAAEKLVRDGAASGNRAHICNDFTSGMVLGETPDVLKSECLDPKWWGVGGKPSLYDGTVDENSKKNYHKVPCWWKEGSLYGGWCLPNIKINENDENDVQACLNDVSFGLWKLQTCTTFAENWGGNYLAHARRCCPIAWEMKQTKL